MLSKLIKIYINQVRQVIGIKQMDKSAGFCSTIDLGDNFLLAFFSGLVTFLVGLFLGFLIFIIEITADCTGSGTYS